MRSEGRDGNAPGWYLLIRAARYAHVPAWELARQPYRWQASYLAAADEELAAENYHRRQQERRQQLRH